MSATLLSCHTDMYKYLSEWTVFIAVPHTCDTHDTMNGNYVVRIHDFGFVSMLNEVSLSAQILGLIPLVNVSSTKVCS